MWLSQITLHELYHGGWEVKFFSLHEDITVIQLVLYHKLRQVAYHLRGWSHLMTNLRF